MELLGKEIRPRTYYDNKGTKLTSSFEELNSYGAHKIDYTLQIPWGGTSTNNGNNYSISQPSITSLTTGMAVSFQCNEDSTGAVTLNWKGKGATSIKKANGTDVTNLTKNGIYTVRYNGTNFILQGEGASGDATASDLLLGKTATVGAGEITGTMPENADNDIQAEFSSDVAIPEGHYNGSGYVLKPKFSAGDIVQISDTVANITGSTGYAEKLAVTVGYGGTYRIAFDLKTNNVLYTAYGRIYKNGVAYGTERNTTSTSYVTFTEDLEFSASDEIQIYLKTDNASGTATQANFYIKTAEATAFVQTM